MTKPAADIRTVVQGLHEEIVALKKRLVRSEQQAAALKARLDLQGRGRAPRHEIEFTSQFGEDLVAWKLLGEPPEGFFIEAGAFDGYHYSVTYALEAIGWTGLLVEALPDAAEKCRARRSASRVVHSALSQSGSSGLVAFNALQDQYGGMLSYLKPTQHLAEATSGAPQRQIQVPVTALDDLLAEHRGPIDLVVLDVEGGELDVLDGFDLERFRPRLLIIEDMGRDPALRDYMKQFGYAMVARLAVNDVFARADDRDVLERARWMQLG